MTESFGVFLCAMPMWIFFRAKLKWFDYNDDGIYQPAIEKYMIS